MYNHLEAKLHDLFWAGEGECAELELIKEFLTQYSGTALELGCGSGRLLLPLLKDGYLIEGLDNSTEMLAICEEHTGDLSPILHNASIEVFQTGSLYGAITIPAFTLQFIPIEKLPAVLENIKQHLHPGGALYFTTFIPWAEITGELEEQQWYLDHEVKIKREDGKSNTAQCRTKYSIKRLSQELTREHKYKIISPDKKVLDSSESTHTLTWLWPRELNAILTAAGFTVEKTIGDFDTENPADEDSQIMTIIATISADEKIL